MVKRKRKPTEITRRVDFILDKMNELLDSYVDSKDLTGKEWVDFYEYIGNELIEWGKSLKA